MITATLCLSETGAKSQESPFVSRLKAPEPFTLVLFGATDDLAGRKLLPALAGLLQNKYLPQEFAICPEIACSTWQPIRSFSDPSWKAWPAQRYRRCCGI